MFAKRKKNLFKGPMLALGSQPASNRSREGSHSRNASNGGMGRRSGEITIQEEDEDAEEEEEFKSQGDVLERGDVDEESIEEVDNFSPIVRVPGEKVEEIYEEDEDSQETAAVSNPATTENTKGETKGIGESA